MKYNLNQLIEDFDIGKPLKYVFFWGHQPSKSGDVTASCFSQWWLADFEVENIKYPSAEHWMMAEKARLFNDKETANKILQVKSPAEAKKLGREVKGFDNTIWEENRYSIVKKGNYYKFSQNLELKNFLVSTNNRILVEASPVDFIWGIGMAKDNPDIENPKNWKGPNLLGFALMEVRDELRKEN